MPSEVCLQKILLDFLWWLLGRGVGGVFHSGGKLRNGTVKIIFFNTTFQEKHPTAAKGDVWVVSHCSAMVPHALMGHVESSPAQGGEGVWKMWSRDVGCLVELEPNFVVFFTHLKYVSLC